MSDEQKKSSGAPPKEKPSDAPKSDADFEMVDERSIGEVFGGMIVGFYRWLRSMRTAMIMLLLLATASIVGTLLPQIGQQPANVAGFITKYPTLGPLLDRLQFFNLYGSWWFQLLVVFLLASLISCILPRTKAIFKRMTAPPQKSNEASIRRLSNHVEINTSLDKEAALQATAAVLKRRGFKAKKLEDSDETQMFARKGRWGEVGSLFFHYSIILMIVAAVFGKLYGFEGAAYIIEGQRWTEGHLNYDQLQEGKMFRNNDAHRGFEIEVNDFTAEYHDDEGFFPKDYISDLTVFDDGEEIKSQKIRVNTKLIYKGVKFYQSSYGWAPHLAVTKNVTNDAGAVEPELMYDAPTIFFGDAYVANRTFSIPANPEPNDIDQLWVDAQFSPDIDLTNGTPRSPYLRDRIISVRLLEGPSQVEVGQSFILPGNTETTIGDYTISMPEVKEWTGLQVNSDPGVLYIYIAFTMMVLGIVVAFYVSHRRMWVLAVAEDPASTTKGTTLLVGGIAEKNKDTFTMQFEKLAEDLQAEMDPQADQSEQV